MAKTRSTSPAHGRPTVLMTMRHPGSRIQTVVRTEPAVPARPAQPAPAPEVQLPPSPPAPRSNRLLAIDQAAAYLGVSRATVDRLVFRGQLPFVKVGGATRYDIEDLDQFIDTNRHRNRRRLP